MSLIRTSLLATLLSVSLPAGLATPADAASSCGARMSGTGKGLGIAGQGTDKAKEAALADWSSKVSTRYGRRFGTSPTQRAVRFDCRSGAVLEAKCVVTAVPCK
jgi:hypothetical protein